MQRNLPTIPTLITANTPTLPVIQPLVPTTGQQIFPTVVGGGRTVQTVQVPTTVARPTIPTFTQPATLAQRPGTIPTPTLPVRVQPTFPAQRPTTFPNLFPGSESEDEDDFSDEDADGFSEDEYDSDFEEEISPYGSPTNPPFQPIVAASPFPAGIPLATLAPRQTTLFPATRQTPTIQQPGLTLVPRPASPRTPTIQQPGLTLVPRPASPRTPTVPQPGLTLVPITGGARTPTAPLLPGITGTGLVRQQTQPTVRVAQPPMLPGRAVQTPITLNVTQPVTTPTVPVIRPNIIVPQPNNQVTIPQVPRPNVTTPTIPQVPRPNITTPTIPQPNNQINFPGIQQPTVPIVPRPNVTTPTVPIVPRPNVTTPTVPKPNVTTPTVPIVPRPNVTTPTVPIVPRPNVTTPTVPIVPRPNVTTPTVPIVPRPNVTTPTVPIVPRPNITTPTVPIVPRPNNQTNVPIVPRPNQTNVPIVPRPNQTNVPIIPRPNNQVNIGGATIINTQPFTPGLNNLPVIPGQTAPRIASPIRQQSPVRIASPVRVQTPQSPIRIQTPQSPIRIQTPQSPRVQTPQSPRVQTPQSPRVQTPPQSPIRIQTPPQQVPNLGTAQNPRLYPASPVRVQTPQSPRILPQSPQRTPINGTVTGGPVIPVNAPELVPVPRLVPIQQQEQVNPIPAQQSPRLNQNVVPIIGTPIVTPRTPNGTNIQVPTSPRSPLLNRPASPRPNSPGRQQAIPIMNRPASPRLNSPGRQQANPIVGGIVEHVDGHNHQGHTHQDCCICMEPTVSPGRETGCGHAVCADCTKMLRKAECPVCRAKLEAGYLTQDANQAIQAATRNDNRVQELRNAVSAEYINMFPNREGAELNTEAYDFSNAFTAFIESNPNMTLQDTIRIFRAFVEFAQRERQIDRNMSLNELMIGFSIIGLEMLEDRALGFNEIYQQFFRQEHI